MNQPTFQYYSANIKAAQPIGIVTLIQFLHAIKNPKAEIAEVYAKIRKAEIDQDLKLKADLKQKLYSFTPAINVKGRRRYLDIVSFTGLMPLDFDHLESRGQAEEFRDFLINDYSFIVAAWLSSSGRGVRALVRIPNLTDEVGKGAIKKYKALFNGLAKNATFEGFDGFDYAPKNCVLPLFLSYDKGLKSRGWEEAETWEGVWVEPERVAPVMDVRSDSSVNYSLNERRISGIVRSALSKISDSGHLILRSIAFTVGGYVGGGEISFIFAENLLYLEIDNHAYLRQKANTYKRTATDMLKLGEREPMRLK